MKSIFKVFATVTFLTITGATLQAQHQNHKELSAEQMADKRTEKMTQSLELTEEQQSEVYRINLAAAEKIKQVNGEKLTTAERRERKKQIAQTAREQLSAILTEEQMKKMKAQMQERRGERKVR